MKTTRSFWTHAAAMATLAAAAATIPSVAGLRGDEPSTAPAAGIPVAKTVGVASTMPATSPADEREEAAMSSLLRTAKDSFVVVEYWYKKDTSEVTTTGEERDYQMARLYDEYVDKKRPEERSGIVLDGNGRVLVNDDGLEDRFLDHVIVKDAAGNRYSAERSRLMFDCPGVLLQIDANFAARLKPLKFAALAGGDVTELRLSQARHYQVDDEWRVAAGALAPAIKYEANAPDDAYFGYLYRPSSGQYGSSASNAPVVIADPNGLPLGCAVSSFLDVRQRDLKWLGPDLENGDGIDWPQLRKTQDAARAKLIDCVQEVIIRLRSEGEASSRGGPSGREVSIYGIAISPTDILVPHLLDSQSASEIDKIFIKFSPTRRGDAQFVGAYKAFGGFVVRLKKDPLPSFVKLAADDPQRMKPFWEARMRKRQGNKYVDLVANRLIGKAEGYAGKYYWYPARDMHSGSCMVNLQGEVVGFNLAERIEHEEERRLETSDRSSYSPTVRVFLASDVRDALSPDKLAASLDRKIIVKTRSESHRRPWLGVEYVGANSDLAEQLKVEKDTHQGSLGFIVNAVYPHSPAEKMGLQIGDILLKIKSPNQNYPIELSSDKVADTGADMGRYYHGGGDEEEVGGRTWKSRSNFITKALDAIGLGTKVEITYCRPDPNGGAPKVAALDYEIEQAPLDQDSSPHWQNRKLGPTIKDLTYEVRYALNLKDNDPGVVVAAVEDGSPMVVARIMPDEIITRLDDQPLTSARQMRDLIAKAKAAGKAKVRLTVLKLGKTRFADLPVNEYDPAEDEGLDEE